MKGTHDTIVVDEGVNMSATKELYRDEPQTTGGKSTIATKTTRTTGTTKKSRPSQLRTTMRDNITADDTSTSTPTTASIQEKQNLDIELPHLPYDLGEHKLSIFLYWTAIATECCFIPISFYYGLSNGTDLRPGAMFAIITAVFGFVTGFEYAMRGWRLLQRSEHYRPLHGAKRFWGFDTVHWTLMGPYFVMTALMIGVSIPDPPKTRGLSTVLPVGMIMVGTVMVATGIANAMGWRLRGFRMSSHVQGSVCPPLTFCILEDMVAVDGRGGKPYREAAMARYQVSPRFRRLLVELLWAWALTAIALGAGVIAIAFTIPEHIAYGLGWGLPTIWGALGAFLTILWCKRSVRIERGLWESRKGVVA